MNLRIEEKGREIEGTLFGRPWTPRPFCCHRTTILFGQCYYIQHPRHNINHAFHQIQQISVHPPRSFVNSTKILNPSPSSPHTSPSTPPPTSPSKPHPPTPHQPKRTPSSSPPSQTPTAHTISKRPRSTQKPRSRSCANSHVGTPTPQPRGWLRNRSLCSGKGGRW